MLYADRNSRHDASCQEGLHIRISRMAPVFFKKLQLVLILHKHITTLKRTKTSNSLTASASQRCDSSRIVRNVILLPPPRRTCLSDTGVMPVLDATSQLASSRSCLRTPFLTTALRWKMRVCGLLMSCWHRVYPIRRVKLCSASVQRRD